MARKGMGTFTDAAGVVWRFWRGRWRKAVPRKQSERKKEAQILSEPLWLPRRGGDA